MNETGAVNGVLAIIAGVMMSAAHIDFSPAHKRIQAGLRIFKLGSGMARIVSPIRARLRQKKLCMAEIQSWNLGQIGVAGSVDKAGIGQFIPQAAPLVIYTQGVSPRQAST